MKSLQALLQNINLYFSYSFLNIYQSIQFHIFVHFIYQSIYLLVHFIIFINSFHQAEITFEVESQSHLIFLNATYPQKVLKLTRISYNTDHIITTTIFNFTINSVTQKEANPQDLCRTAWDLPAQQFIFSQQINIRSTIF